MAQDPVLQREMFNPRDRSAKGSGITSMVDDGSSGMTREERLQMAKDMLAEAQMKQSPEYYFKTLAQGDRPAMTRPVASSAPPPAMQQMPAAQQMAQMQAAGIRPVGMADGGIVRRGFFAGGLNTVDPRTLTPQQRIEKEKRDLDAFNMRMSDLPAPENLFLDQTPEEMRTITKANPTPFDPYQMEGGLNEAVTYNRAEDPSTWTPDFKEAMIDKIYKEELSGIQSITERAASAGMIVEKPSREKIARDIENKAASIRSSRKETPARQDMIAREQAAPDKRDYAGDRLSNVLRGAENERTENAQRAGMQEAASAETARLEGITSLGRITEDQTRRDEAMPDRRDYAQGRRADADLAEMAKNKSLMGSEVRIGTTPGAAAEAARPMGGIAELGPSASIAAAQSQADAAAKDQAGASAQEPARYSATTTLESIKSERAKEREDNFNMALIQAGLAMMGGKSSNALANIGEGGMQGIKQFSEQEREATRGYREDVKGVREEERFARAERRAADEFSQRERMQGASLTATRELTLAQLASTEATNRVNREIQQGQFKTTEERLSKALAADIGTTAANLNISRETLQLARDKNSQDVSQFMQTLDLKRDEYAKDLTVAAAKQDEALLTNLHKNISDDLQSIQNNKTRLLGNATAGMMDPDAYGAAMKQFDSQEAALRGQLMSLRGNMSDRLKISLPTPDLASASTGTVDFNTLK